MNDPAAPSPEENANEKQIPASLDRKSKLSEIVRLAETEENLKKLAKKLEDEWKADDARSQAPDLSYARFAEKLKNSSNQ